MQRAFRTLIVLSFLLHAFGLFVLPQLPWLFSQDTLELMKYSGHGAKINVGHPALYLLYLLPYPGLVALFFFKQIGRYLFAFFVAAVGASTFLFGASVSGPPETFVSFLTLLSDGGILALIFASPIKESFAHSKRVDPGLSCTPSNPRGEPRYSTGPFLTEKGSPACPCVAYGMRP